MANRTDKEIFKTETTGWDQKKGMMTQAMKLGEVYQDVIRIRSDRILDENGAKKNLAAGDIVWLTTLRSSVCVTKAQITRQTLIGTKDIKVNLCLLGIDRDTEQPYTFKYANDTDVDILDNLGTDIVDGSSNASKISGPVTLGANPKGESVLGDFICRADKKTAISTYQVLNANIGKVWTMRAPDMTLGMIAEWTLGDQYNNSGVSTGKPAVGYETTSWRGIAQFGIGLSFAEGLTSAELDALGLYVTLEYKNSMVSENSYGRNYINAGNQQVTAQFSNSINGVQPAMTQQNFDISNTINSDCRNISEAVSEVNRNISNQTNVLQNQMTQNSFAIERRFCVQDQLIREEGNATRAAIDNLSKQTAQYRYNDLMKENCSLDAQSPQTNASNKPTA